MSGNFSQEEMSVRMNQGSQFGDYFVGWKAHEKKYRGHLVFGLPKEYHYGLLKSKVSNLSGVDKKYILRIDRVYGRVFEILTYVRFDEEFLKLHGKVLDEYKLSLPYDKTLRAITEKRSVELTEFRLQQWKSRLHYLVHKKRSLKSGLLKFMEFRMEHLDGKITEEFKAKCVKEAMEKASATTLSIEDISVCTIGADDGSGPEEEEWLRADMEVEEEKNDKKKKRGKTSSTCVFSRSQKRETKIGDKKGKVSFDMAKTKAFWQFESPISIGSKKEKIANIDAGEDFLKLIRQDSIISNGKLRVASWNVQSWNTNSQSVMDSIIRNEIGICFILEARIKELSSVKTNSIIHYTPCNKKTNGMAVILHPQLLHLKGLVQVIHSDDYKITLKVSNVIVSGVYFPPKLSKTERLKRIEGDKILMSSDAILGDFNIHRKDGKWRKLIENMEKRGLIRDPNDSKTHKSGNAIDHIFYSPQTFRQFKAKYIWGECSDHKLIFFDLAALKLDNHKRIQAWRLKNSNVKKLIQARAKKLHSNNTNNVDTLNRRLHTFIKSIYDPITEDFRKKYYLSKEGDTFSKYKWFLHKISTDGNLLRNISRWKRTRLSLMEVNPIANIEEDEISSWFDRIWKDTGTFTSKNELNFTKLTISSEEVRDAIRIGHNSRAPGMDGVKKELVIPILEQILPIIVRLFTKCVEQQKVPTLWKTAKVKMLHKKGDPYNLDNYRPICLLPYFRKIFECVLYQKHKSIFDKVHPSQSGFLPKRSTIDRIEKLDQICKTEQAHVVFVDFAKAFDTCCLEPICSSLEKKGIGTKLLFQLFSGSSYIFKERNFVADKGVQQGSVLGPKLFLHFIDNLLKSLEHRGIIVLAYADDIAMVSANRNVMEDGLYLLKQWTERYKVQINISPNGTKTASFSKGLYFGDIEIPFVSTYKYLGLQFDSKGLDWKEVLLNKASSIRRRSFVMKKFGITKSGFRWKYKVNAFNAFVKSVVQYGNPLFPAWVCRKVDTLIASSLNALHNYNCVFTHRKTTFSTHNIAPTIWRSSKYRNEVKERGTYSRKLNFLNKNGVNVPNFINICLNRIGFVKGEECLICSEPAHGFHVLQHIDITKEQLLLYRRFWNEPKFILSSRDINLLKSSQRLLLQAYSHDSFVNNA